MAQDVTATNLKAHLQHPLVVLDCWADWCGPCKMMAPVLKRLEAKYQKKIVFLKINVKDAAARQMVEHYKVFSLPSLVIFEHGKAHEEVTGFYPFGALDGFFQKKLQEI